MSSKQHSDDLDIERGLPTTPEDVAALRTLPQPAMTDEQYMRFLAAFPATHDELAAKPITKGEPFRLP